MICSYSGPAREPVETPLDELQVEVSEDVAQGRKDAAELLLVLLRDVAAAVALSGVI